MKKNVIKGIAVLALSLAFTACKNDSKTAEISDAKTVEIVTETLDYNVDSSSLLIWKANKIVGGHEGTFNVAKGTAQIKDKALVGGVFMFDIASLKCTDIPVEEEGNAKLVSHLLNEDFFDAEKFPNAKFEITKVENSKVSGNLTLKGITKNVTFNAKVTSNENTITVTSDMFTIDRTEWNINHNSGKIMDAAKLGDYLIKDNVELKINVTAKKA